MLHKTLLIVPGFFMVTIMSVVCCSTDDSFEYRKYAKDGVGIKVTGFCTPLIKILKGSLG